VHLIFEYPKSIANFPVSISLRLSIGDNAKDPFDINK
jgi:hypothetical protein